MKGVNMQQTFVVTKKKDIADRNEKEFEQKRILQEKYNLEHADYLNFIKQQNKKKKPNKSQVVETPFKYTVEDMEKLIDPYINQMPQKVLKHLKKMKPKIFSPREDKYKLVKDWRNKWKKRPHLTDKDYNFLKNIYDNHMRKVKLCMDAKEMIKEANVNGAESPHKHFLKRIIIVQGVMVNKVEVQANNDTSIYFRYKGNDVVAICYGEQLEDRKRYLPTKLIINGEEKDVTNRNIKECVREIPSKLKRIVVVKKKVN